MPVAIIKTLVQAGLMYGLSEFLFKSGNAQLKLKRFAGGIALLIVSGLTVFLSIVFFAASLFFFLSDMQQGIRPALIVAVILLLGAGLMAIEAFRMMRRPRI